MVAEFCTVFYGYWFLKCPLTASAQLNDLKAIQDMKSFMEVLGKEEMAEACLESWSRHLDYLSPSLVVFFLADCEVEDDQKESVAQALLQIKKDNPIIQFLPGNGKIIVPGPDFVNNLDYWPTDGSLPGLEKFVGKKSWLLCHYLRITDHALQWLEDKASEWNTYESFRQFEQFVTKLLSVNDPAERTVK